MPLRPRHDASVAPLEANRAHAPSTASPLTVVDRMACRKPIGVQSLPIHAVGAAPEQIDGAIVSHHQARELEALLFAIEVPVAIGHRRGGLVDRPLHVDEAKRDPLCDVGHAGVLANVVMKAYPSSAGRGRDARRSRDAERGPDHELAARWRRDDHARPRAFVAHLDAPPLMLRLELGTGIIDGMRHARRPAHDRGAMVGRYRLALHRAVVRQTEPQDALLVARPRQDVQERPSIGHRLQPWAPQVPLWSLFDERHVTSVCVAERA